MQLRLNEDEIALYLEKYILSKFPSGSQCKLKINWRTKNVVAEVVKPSLPVLTDAVSER